MKEQGFLSKGLNTSTFSFLCTKNVLEALPFFTTTDSKLSFSVLINSACLCNKFLQACSYKDQNYVIFLEHFIGYLLKLAPN